MTNTPDLIEQLTAHASPVKRLRPPAWRAAIWLAVYGVVLALAVIVFDAWPNMRMRLQSMPFVWEIAGTVLTGVAAIVAAFYLALPDRSRSIALLVVPPLAVWLGSSGYGCLVNIGDGGDGWLRSSHCVMFIIGTSVPLGLALYVVLRRAVPLDPLAVLAVGGLGVAALSAVVLQFFHPFDTTIIDLVLHMVAVLTVVAVMTTLGRRGMQLPA